MSCLVPTSPGTAVNLSSGVAVGAGTNCNKLKHPTQVISGLLTACQNHLCFIRGGMTLPAISEVCPHWIHCLFPPIAAIQLYLNQKLQLDIWNFNLSYMKSGIYQYVCWLSSTEVLVDLVRCMAISVK